MCLNLRNSQMAQKGLTFDEINPYTNYIQHRGRKLQLSHVSINGVHETNVVLEKIGF